MRATLAISVLLAAITASAEPLGAQASSADPFEVGLEQARVNEASAEWRDYSGPFLEQLGPVLQRAMRKCFPESVDAAGIQFTIVFSVRGNGTLEQLMVRPESTNTACVLRRMELAQVPAPPRPDWWAFLDLKVTP